MIASSYCQAIDLLERPETRQLSFQEVHEHARDHSRGCRIDPEVANTDASANTLAHSPKAEK